jgi:hypothetical protein
MLAGCSAKCSKRMTCLFVLVNDYIYSDSTKKTHIYNSYLNLFGLLSGFVLFWVLRSGVLLIYNGFLLLHYKKI